MKKIYLIISIAAASCSFGYAQNQDPYNDNSNGDTNATDDTYYDNSADQQADDGSDGVSYQTFYDQLSPYGSWVNYPGYGYCWDPQTNGDFTPYQTDGDWQYTDDGWAWVSDYPWGWATFHYGRWFFDAGYGGWLWMPGYDWAPAWVTWGMYGDFYCWTPIGPRDFVNGRWGYGAYDHHWSCLPRGHMGEHGIGKYIVRDEAVNHDRAAFEKGVSIVNHTSTYGRSVYNAGPKVEDVQKATGRTIKKMTINNTDKPGKTEVKGNSVNVYRPAISRSTTQRAVPKQVVNPSESHAAGANTPAHTTEQHSSPGRSNTNMNTERAAPVREAAPAEREQPEREISSPPRQSAPFQSHSSGGGFIPSSRPSGGGGMGGGGFHGGGGGRR